MFTRIAPWSTLVKAAPVRPSNGLRAIRAPATASTARTSEPAIGPQSTVAASVPARRRNNSAGNKR